MCDKDEGGVGESDKNEGSEGDEGQGDDGRLRG